jgi:rhodanese-related sulfurtransferase
VRGCVLAATQENTTICNTAENIGNRLLLHQSAATTAADNSYHRAIVGDEVLPQQIKIGFQELIDAANREIETLPAMEALALAGRDDVVFVDLRDIRELEREGRMPGAFHCPRGMLEFWIDPASPYHKPVFAEDKQFVFFCASGWRSALAAQTAARMGLKPVAHISGGFSGWKKAGGPTETKPR